VLDPNTQVKELTITDVVAGTARRQRRAIP
jgi:hypothetical protein